MAKISIFSSLSTVQILLHTLFKGKCVGKDHLGNKYYRGKGKPHLNREDRWVLYKGEPEASLVPPEWHAWLHHQTNVLPANDSPYRKEWQKPHQPNLTGTDQAYFPPGDVRGGGKRDKATGDYVAWQPPQ